MTQTIINENVLVSTDWASDHLKDNRIRFVEVDVDTQSYENGHIPGAIGWNWQTQLQDSLRRTIALRADFEELLGASGIENDTWIILYGDNNNWFAAWAYWLLKYYGHERVKILDGGRLKWLNENKAVTTEIPTYEKKIYVIDNIRSEFRAFRSDIFDNIDKNELTLVDVRSPDEYNGKILAPPGLQELSQRPGHIPGARNIPWSKAVADDGTFKPADELKKIYSDHGITPDKNVVAYCRIGERSAHSWFVLNELLRYPNVRNYDGSWTEWGNLIEAPIER